MKLPDALFAKMWDTMDWDAAETKLADYQARLTRAAYRGDGEEIERLQKQLVRNSDMKCLAVRQIITDKRGKGDGQRRTVLVNAVLIELRHNEGSS